MAKKQAKKVEKQATELLASKQSSPEIVQLKSAALAERERQMKTFGAVKTKSIAEVKGIQQDFVTINKKVNYENFARCI